MIYLYLHTQYSNTYIYVYMFTSLLKDMYICLYVCTCLITLKYGYLQNRASALRKTPIKQLR